MCAFYVLWDTMDDLLFRKENESDSALFARMSGPTIHGKYFTLSETRQILTLLPRLSGWLLIWLAITIGFVSLGVLGGEYSRRACQIVVALTNSIIPQVFTSMTSLQKLSDRPSALFFPLDKKHWSVDDK
jgi:hypothetical protein